MYYQVKEQSDFVTYEVQLDVAKLTDLKEQILVNCAEIVRCSYEPDSSFINGDSNISETSFQGVKYYPPVLFQLLEQLLRGNVLVVKYLQNPLPTPKSKIKIHYEQLAQKVMEKVQQNDLEQDSCLLKQYALELEAYQDYLKLNKNQKSEMDYYALVWEAIHLKEVSRSASEVISGDVKSYDNKNNRDIL